MEGGSQQINSGRFWRSKRDNILHDYLIEARTTEKGSYRIEKQEFLDIERQALQTPPGMYPGMQIDLGTLKLIVVRLEDFQTRELRIRELEAMLETGIR